jgi:trimethylamine--corrinoid protein Co-methyltransferase
MPEKSRELLAAGMKNEQRFDFRAAKEKYTEVKIHFPESGASGIAQDRLEDMDDLIQEKEIYERIDENAKRVLTDIGINIAENPRLTDILMQADAINFESDSAVFIPLKRDYLEACLETVPRNLPCDPGPNAFGIGATPPFLARPGKDTLRAASKEEFQRIVDIVGEYADVIKIFSLPVATDKSLSVYEATRIMDRGFAGLKMTASKSFGDGEMNFLKGRDDWLDGTTLITALTPMHNMLTSFIRSAGTGVNMLLLDLSIAGCSAAGSPEALLTQVHAQVLFMMVIAQTVNPRVLCMHGGIPCVAEAGGDLSYSSPQQPLINAAMARVNRWVTGFPSAQSGGSTSITEMTPEAVTESELSRNTLRKYGAHIVRHAMGALGNLNYFSLEKLIEDCERERRSAEQFETQRQQQGIIPLYFPGDADALAGIREIAEKGNPKDADHTLMNVESFMLWEQRIHTAARRKLYHTGLNDTVIEQIKEAKVAV